ncbi:MAG: N-acetylneuraminate synthase family protein [Desulfobacterales bacterium]|nr:N-acetylneuraminate synthase family protein [Desulfobacterales bacterium]
MQIPLGKRKVGDGEPVFIVFEAGPTHNGIESAKALASYASEAGADAVKFQILDPVRLVPDKSQMFSYEILVDKKTGEHREKTEPLYDILMRRYLTFDQWREVKAHCDKLGIVFFSTVTFKDEVDFLKDINAETIKICSGDVNHLPFIRYCAKTGMSIQLDTGNATIGEVERAYDEVIQAGNDNVIIHNCPSGYPARLESINLKIIPTLKQMFGCPVAFSDHTPGWEMDIAAIALGANMVEKTITLDRTTPSVEHLFSIEPDEMKQFVRSVRDLEKALGHYRRTLSPEERKAGVGARRSIILKEDVEKGQVLDTQVLDYARPGAGLTPDLTDSILGTRFTRNLIKGHRLDWEDFG